MLMPYDPVYPSQICSGKSIKNDCQSNLIEGDRHIPVGDPEMNLSVGSMHLPRRGYLSLTHRLPERKKP